MFVSQGRKKQMARQGLEHRTSRIPCEHSDHWATKPHGRPVTISPCLIRFVPESARNHAGTDETVPLLLAARARTHTEPPNVTEEEKAHGPTGTRTQDLSHTVRALWPLSYQATRSTCDICMKFYRIGNRPKYIDLLKSRNERAMITKLRISAHKLRIEGGRYINIPKCERFCNVYDSGKIEDESHFYSSVYSPYKALRQGCRSKLKILIIKDLILTILDNHYHCILKLSSDFIGNC